LSAVKPPNPKYIPKPCESISKPGERVKIDVKFVPAACLGEEDPAGERFFQYAAIDEYSRRRYAEGFRERNTCASNLFPEHLVRAFPCKIECARTGSGSEFTNRFASNKDKPAMFELCPARHGIRRKPVRVPIRPAITEKLSAAAAKTTGVSTLPTPFPR
jgi:hypothetical protein